MVYYTVPSLMSKSHAIRIENQMYEYDNRFTCGNIITTTLVKYKRQKGNYHCGTKIPYVFLKNTQLLINTIGKLHSMLEVVSVQIYSSFYTIKYSLKFIRINILFFCRLLCGLKPVPSSTHVC